MPERPKPSDVKRAISGTIDDAAVRLKEQEALDQSRAALHHIDGLKDFYAARRYWSWFLIWCIGFSLAFQIALTFLVGVKKLDFQDYKWFLPIVISENFIQIISLALIVVKWLFSGAPPNRMLEHRDS